MNQRSEFILGKYVFIKLIQIKPKVSQSLKEALENPKKYLPFTTKEMVMSYLLSQDENLITPGTKVLVSSNSFEISFFDKYFETSYEETLKDLKKNFIGFEDYLENMSEIKSGIIISKKIDGNLDMFLSSHKESKNALIHIAHLYYEYQRKYKAIHGDPKTANYTWVKLDKPVNMTYKFDKFTIKRNVQNLFFLTDLEFVYSPIIKSKTIKDKKIYFNFSKKYEYMKDDRNDLIYLPKISAEPFYDYNLNLYGGYDQKIIKKASKIQEIFGLFPRFLSLDILILVKMLLTWYPEVLNSETLRKLNIYFTRFLSLSEKEKQFKYKVNYEPVSPSSFAKIMNA